jgi:hypothetical protein
LSRAVAELVVRRVAHLVVVLRVVAATAATTLRNKTSTALVLTGDGVTRLPSEVSAVRLWLTHGVGVLRS